MAVPVTPGALHLPGALEKKLRGDTTDINQRWKGGWPMGAGSQGLVALWVSYNDRDRISDRMIVKTILTSRYEWYDPASWSDGLNARGTKNFDTLVIDHQMPIEGVIHQRLTERTQGPVIPPGHAGPPREHPMCQYRGRSRVDEENRRWKLFMEWCPLGDLSELIGKYHAAQAEVPEPFIWYIAEGLLLAIQLMQQGTNDATPVAHWRPMVHRDVKPCNVFLSYRSDVHFRHYPKVKLSDFGMVCETSRRDLRNNPINYFDDAGTPGFIAPEQRRWYKRSGKIDTSPKRRLDEKTNVWGVGMTLWCLVYLDQAPVQLDYNAQAAHHRVPFWRRVRPTGGLNLYSQYLINFADTLTHFEYANQRGRSPSSSIGIADLPSLASSPDQRPTIAQALQSIRNPPPGPAVTTTIDGMDVAEPRIHISRDQHPHRLQHVDWRGYDGRLGLGKPRGRVPKIP